jgi:DNA-binding transcriptional LysR family regulator
MSRSEHVTKRLKLQQMRVFLAVARTGSMAKAARHVGISQSVISKSIAELETLLGVPLFDRTPLGVEPTRYGEVLLRHSITVFDDLRTGLGEIEFMTDPSVGELRIGTTEPQTGVVAAVIKQLTRQSPGLDFNVAVAHSATLIDRQLRGRQIDLVVAPLPEASLVQDLDSTFLYDNWLRLIVGTENRWARRRKVSLADLINEPWCAPPADTVSGAALINAFHASGLPLPRIIVTTPAYYFHTQLTADQRFIGVSSNGLMYFNANGPPVKALPVDLPAAHFAIVILTLKNRTITPAARLFIECAREITRPLAKVL